MDIQCEASEAIRRIARRVAGESVPLPAYGSRRAGWFRRRLRKPLREVVRR